MIRWTLPPEKIPSAWFNVAPHLPTPLQPSLHPATREPVGPDDLAPLFPAALIEQEMATAPWIDIPGTRHPAVVAAHTVGARGPVGWPTSRLEQLASKYVSC